MTQNSITRSWVASANGHTDFPLQNLPLGVFSLNGSAPRAGVAIGEHIFDLQVALEAGLFDGAARSAVEAMHGGQLNAFFELGREARVALRERLLELFSEGSTHRGNIEAQGAQAVIPPRSNRLTQRAYDRHLYKDRNLVERFFCRLKQFRRIATRYEKLAQNFMSMLSLASAYVWLA